MKLKIATCLLWMILLAFVPTSPSTGNITPQVIFTNHNLNRILVMNRGAVQRIFTRKDVRWSDGKAIVVYTKPLNSLEHKIFVSHTLNMSIYRFQRELESSTYSAKAVPLREVDTDADMVREIETHEGAIGYVNYELIMRNKDIIIFND